MLYSIWKKLFHRPPSEEEETCSAMITFKLFPHNNPGIDFSYTWYEESQENARHMGSLLYCLNRGMLFESMMKCLKDDMIDSPDKRAFISQVISSWELLYGIETSTNNSPMVKPLTAFHNDKS